jgi:putative phosphoesterase
MKIGIISDTHIRNDSGKDKVSKFVKHLKEAFKDVDEIVHVGDVSENFFLDEIKKIAPTRCVRGNLDNIDNLENFFKFTIGQYHIGVIHLLPDNIEEFAKEHNLNILIFGHTHQPIIKGTEYDLLLLNPGSPTLPKAPQERPGFMRPVPRPTVITLNIDENDIISTFIITLKN